MMDFYQDPFFCVPRSTHTTSQGKVELPILYYDSSAVLIFFGCERHRVEHLLPAGRFRPTLTWGKRAVVGLALFKYRATSIGAYNEVGLAIPVVWQNGPMPICPVLELLRNDYSRRVGFHIVDLPVTTAAAHAAGRELWGYPKFVTRIDFSLQKNRLFGRVYDPDNQTRGDGFLHWRGDLRMRIGQSSHPMAYRLRHLGLDQTRPLCLWAGTRFQSRLSQGAPLTSQVAME